MTDQELGEALDEHDGYVHSLLRGDIDWLEFLEAYADFYWRFALDGHEATDVEAAILAAARDRIEPHRRICEDVLANVCADDDAAKAAYQASGRVGSLDAIRLIGGIVRDCGGEPLRRTT